MVNHPDSDRLARSMAKCAVLSIPWTGDLYRFCSPRYANKDDILTGVGSKNAGGRWNPPNSFCTVYTSLDPHTAVDEALAHFVHYGWRTAKAMPRTMVSLEARLQRVLDLTNGAIRRVLGVSERRLLDEDWRKEQEKEREALTQAIGRLVFDFKLEGLLVASAPRRGGVNLVIFPDNLVVLRSRLKILNKNNLPPRPPLTA